MGTRTCGTCGGSGTYKNSTCQTCGGSGEVVDAGKDRPDVSRKPKK